MPLNKLHLSALFWGCAALVAASLLLGGGTRPGFAGDVVLQLLSVPLLLAGLAALWRHPKAVAKPAASGPAALRSAPPSAGDKIIKSSHKRALVFCGLLVLVPVLQLLPLPAGVRGLFAGKAWIDESFALTGQEAPAWPLSMVPHATWLALLSLLPPIAIFIAMLNLTYRERRMVSVILLGLAVISAFLGMLQLAQGPESPLRFFEITNPTEAVGFFANRNHFSALLYTATAFTACWIIWAAHKAADDAQTSPGRWYESAGALYLVASVLIFMCLVMAQAMARSRAGLMLTAVALFAAPAIVLTGGQAFAARKALSRTVAAAAVVAIIFALQYALYRILERMTSDPLEDARVQISAKTWQAAKAFLPFGSGVGTFVPVYALFEEPKDAAHFFANHAHNDVFEALLESGVAAAVLMVAFAVWLTRRAIAVWSGQVPHGAGETDLALMKAATLALALLTLHSFVDYPLRTSAMMAVAAVSAGLLVVPRKAHGASHHHASHHSHGHAHHESAHAPVMQAAAARAAPPPAGRPHGASASSGTPPLTRPPPSRPAPGAPAPLAPGDAPATKPYQRWDGPVEWPKAWQQNDSGGAPPGGGSEPQAKNRKPGSEE